MAASVRSESPEGDAEALVENYAIAHVNDN